MGRVRLHQLGVHPQVGGAAVTPAAAGTLNDVLEKAADQAPLLVVVVIIVWLSLPQLAERFDVIARLAAPLLRKQQAKVEEREKERRRVALETAREDVRLVLAELTPPDVKRMEDRQKRLERQLDDIEDAENMLRAYVIYDELWHFHDDHDAARKGEVPAQRISFDQFEQKWKKGWRPFDREGRLVDDGIGEQSDD